jgi:glycosyltransferase involved in cell wall biosynthesis
VVVYIHDTIDLLLYADRFKQRGRLATVAWSDTCLVPDPYVGLNPLEDVTHIVASEHNFKNFIHYGVSGWLPRPVNIDEADRVRERNLRKKSYYAVIGYQDPSDRKNFSQLRDVVDVTRIPVIALTNGQGPWRRIDYASLSERLKFELLARARFLIFLSKAEGFGMPPAESMAVGTPVIYSDVPAHSHFSVGFGVEHRPEYLFSMREPSGKLYHSMFCDSIIDSAITTVRRAATIEEDAYAELRRQCIAKAERFRPEITVEQFHRSFVAPHLDRC